MNGPRTSCTPLTAARCRPPGSRTTCCWSRSTGCTSDSDTRSRSTYGTESDSAGSEIVQCAQKDFHRAVEISESHPRLSFGDATIAAYMERTGIEYLYSFDDDFDGIEGISRLETANNPFE